MGGSLLFPTEGTASETTRQRDVGPGRAQAEEAFCSETGDPRHSGRSLLTALPSVCCSLLREHSIDGTGWAPTRTLKVECGAFATASRKDSGVWGPLRSLLPATCLPLSVCASVLCRCFSVCSHVVHGHLTLKAAGVAGSGERRRRGRPPVLSLL